MPQILSRDSNPQQPWPRTVLHFQTFRSSLNLFLATKSCELKSLQCLSCARITSTLRHPSNPNPLRPLTSVKSRYSLLRHPLHLALAPLLPRDTMLRLVWVACLLEQLGRACTEDSTTLAHTNRIIYAGSPSSCDFGLENGHVPSFCFRFQSIGTCHARISFCLQTAHAQGAKTWFRHELRHLFQVIACDVCVYVTINYLYTYIHAHTWKASIL